MPPRNREDHTISRRIFLKRMGWAPVLFLPAPLAGISPRLWFPSAAGTPPFAADDVRLTPHYPSPSPLDDVLRFALPGTDEYLVEGYVFEIMRVLNEWGRQLRTTPPAVDTLKKFVDVSIQSTDLVPVRDVALRPGNPIEAFR